MRTACKNVVSNISARTRMCAEASRYAHDPSSASTLLALRDRAQRERKRQSSTRKHYTLAAAAEAAAAAAEAVTSSATAAEQKHHHQQQQQQQQHSQKRRYLSPVHDLFGLVWARGAQRGWRCPAQPHSPRGSAAKFISALPSQRDTTVRIFRIWQH